MKKIVTLFLVLAMTSMFIVGNVAFAVDGAEREEIELDYLEIVDMYFPGYQEGQVSPQWTSGKPDAADPLTHGYITQVACDLLRSDNTTASSFYAGYRSKLVRGSVLPDDDEKDGNFVWHFYGPDGTNYLGGSVTAYTKCIDHYNRAVSLYNAGSKSAAMEELGRALHYLQDVNEPHHAMNKVAVLTNHIGFEKEAEENRTSYALTGLTSSIYSDANNSLGTTIDYYARIARGWYDKAASSSANDRASAAGSCMRNAQRATATVLYKFMMEVR